jgi:hypothetical protein
MSDVVAACLLTLIVSAVAVGCTLSVTSIQLFSVDWDNYKSSLYYYFSEGGRVYKSVTGRWHEKQNK